MGRLSGLRARPDKQRHDCGKPQTVCVLTNFTNKQLPLFAIVGGAEEKNNQKYFSTLEVGIYCSLPLHGDSHVLSSGAGRN